MTTLRADFRAAALAFARAGIPVFPIVPDQKRPLTGNGLHDATTDPEQIQRWWRRWPEANLAMPTGPRTWDVLDIDTKHNQPGLASLAKLRQAGLVGGPSRVVRTPSGGLHLYFAGTDQRNSTIPGHGVDFRSTGGYVLLPPSALTVDDERRSYRTIGRSVSTNVRAVDWQAIRDHLKPPSPRATPQPFRQERDPGRRMAYLVRHVEYAQEGNRNMALFWAANRAVDNGSTNLAPLSEAAVRNGLSRREAERTVTSAARRTVPSTSNVLQRRACSDQLQVTYPSEGQPGFPDR